MMPGAHTVYVAVGILFASLCIAATLIFVGVTATGGGVVGACWIWHARRDPNHSRAGASHRSRRQADGELYKLYSMKYPDATDIINEEGIA